MAGGPYDGQIYFDVRPQYPSEWYSMLSALTPRRALAWDVGTGNGQAAVGIAEHYDSVIATDISEGQLEHGIPHPQIRYLHTPDSLSEEELVAMVGGENSVDLVVVATAIHWFDIPKFYSVVNRVLRKPGGLIAIWGYSDIIGVNPELDALQIRYRESAMPYWRPGVKYIFEEYRNLPFPFKSVGLGEEGQPLKLSMKREMNFERFLDVMRSSSAVGAAKEKGVNLLTEEVVQEFKKAWGAPAPDMVRAVTYNVFMIAGKLKE
ncbi:putative methyltransferase DDB_G0268948 [Punica granatum]|uniref:Methyltransferase DDB_G0268948 n=1 Tax=Punica granatum TaxID=22663 RepID=A0A6P8BTJ1_PUNGR|nr:putative methyltransferase DDB_G0268948 [Punica granatum]